MTLRNLCDQASPFLFSKRKGGLERHREIACDDKTTSTEGDDNGAL
jgi:hypothetical protein